MKDNPKYFYTYTKNLRKTSGLVRPLTDSDNKIIDEPVAETLQRQYSSVWSIPSKDHIVENPSLFFKTSVSDEPKKILFKVRFTKEKVMKAIEKLNKEAAAGPDGVSNLLLYKLRSCISEPLAKIFQDSMDSGKYLWKKQFVIPVLKSGKSKNKAESFRPVSLTSQIGKLMERIVMEEMIEFLVRNKLLSDNQHGFKKARSCLSELLSHHQKILDAILTGDNYDTIYLDYQKAFDQCDQGVAAFALRRFGFQGSLGSWLYDFMRGRQQWVIANNAISSPANVGSGVPQGSVLGPLIFLLTIESINDLDLAGNLGLFADDTRAEMAVSCEADAWSLQLDLATIGVWSGNSNMKFN